MDDVSKFFGKFPPLGQIAVVIVVVLFLVVVFWIIHWLIHRWPKTETVIWFEDLSVEGRQNPDSSRILTSFVLSHLQNARPLQMSELHMDIMPGANEPGFGGLRPAQDTALISGFVPADRPIKIGSVEFSLGDILAFRHWFERPSNEYLLGWLQGSDNEAIAVARLIDSAKKLKGRWRAHSVGSQPRSQAIADLTAKVIVGMNKSMITASWQSLRSFHAGFKQLHLDQVSPLEAANITEARRLFEDALTYDASNWMARFQLALLLCKENEPRTGLEHLFFLESILKRALEQNVAVKVSASKTADQRNPKLAMMGQKGAAEDTCSEGNLAFQGLLQHLREYPECPFLVLYNKAIALSSLPGNKGKARAIALLERLSQIKHEPNIIPAFKTCADQLSERSHVELKLYSLSSQAHILASLRGTQNRLAGKNRYLADRAGQIKKIVKQIEGLCLQRQQEHWGSLQTARAVALSAEARVLAEEGHAVHASKLLHKALAAEPKFVEAYLQLAELYIFEKEKLAPRWDMLAQSQLKHAAEIYPACQETQLLLAVLYCEQLVEKFAAADHILQQLGSLPEANLLLAKNALASSKSDRDVLEPLQRLCHDIRLIEGFGDNAAEELDRLLSTPCLRLVRSSSQFCQLLDALRSILGEALPHVAEEKRLLEAIQQCRAPSNTSAVTA